MFSSFGMTLMSGNLGMIACLQMEETKSETVFSSESSQGAVNCGTFTLSWMTDSSPPLWSHAVFSSFQVNVDDTTEMLPKSRRALTIQEIAALARSSLHGEFSGHKQTRRRNIKVLTSSFCSLSWCLSWPLTQRFDPQLLSFAPQIWEDLQIVQPLKTF